MADAKEAEACWKTCDAVYANTSMALVRWIATAEQNDDDDGDEGGKLDCMCAVGDVIDDTLVGPDVFCDSECKDREMDKILILEHFQSNVGSFFCTVIIG